MVKPPGSAKIDQDSSPKLVCHRHGKTSGTTEGAENSLTSGVTKMGTKKIVAESNYGSGRKYDNSGNIVTITHVQS